MKLGTTGSSFILQKHENRFSIMVQESNYQIYNRADVRHA